MKLRILYSRNIQDIDNLIMKLKEDYEIELEKVLDDNILEVYFDNNIVYIFLDDFDNISIKFSIVIEKINQYFSNKRKIKFKNNTSLSDNRELDEF